MKTIIHVIYPAVKTATRTLAAFAALTLICATASASPPGTGGGTIYYTQACCRSMWSMNSDGTNQTHLGVGTYGPPSTVTYNGKHWFLNTENITPLEYYPDGVARAEVFAYSEDYDYYNNNNPTTKVQLTNDITLQTWGDGLYSLHWVPGGTKISFKARRWNGTVVSEAGIYTGVLQFGPDGAPTGLVALPTTPAISFPLDANQWPNVRTYGWDPTGQKVAYDDSVVLGVADIFGNPHLVIYSGSYSHNPQWSHDGRKIAFNNAYAGISTIGPDGRGLKEIIKRSSSGGYDRPFWSPTDTNIVCFGVSTSGDLDLFRATSTGASLTNLTNTPSTSEYAMGWR